MNDILERIDKRLAKLKKSRRKASLDAGLGPDYIRDLERGATKSPTLGALEKLAPVLETTIPWLADETGPEDVEHVQAGEGDVPVWGEVGAGGKVERFHVDSGPSEWIPSRQGWGPKTAAAKISGESLGRLFDKWYAVYDEVRDPPTADLDGELCICETADGVVYIKRLKLFRGKRWTLESNYDAPIPNVEIVWAAKVKSIVPR